MVTSETSHQPPPPPKSERQMQIGSAAWQAQSDGAKGMSLACLSVSLPRRRARATSGLDKEQRLAGQLLCAKAGSADDPAFLLALKRASESRRLSVRSA